MTDETYDGNGTRYHPSILDELGKQEAKKLEGIAQQRWIAQLESAGLPARKYFID